MNPADNHLKIFHLMAVMGIALTIVIILANVFANGLTYTATDYPTHIAKLYFFEKNGYGSTTTQWNYPIGYTLFETYPPLFFFPARIILSFLRAIEFSYALELSFALMGILLVLALVVISKKFFFQKWESAIIWIGLVFFNPLSINWIFEAGRFPELMGWMIFSLIMGLHLHATTKPFASARWKYTLVLGLLFALQMIAHPGVFIMATIAWFAFMIPKWRTEWIHYAAAWAVGLVVSAWWWIPYRTASAELLLSQYIGFNVVVQNVYVNAFHLLAVLLLLFLALTFHRARHAWKYPFSIFSGIAILGLSGGLSRIPILNQPQQQMYIIFFFFVSILAYIRFHHEIISVWNSRVHEKNVRMIAAVAVLLLLGMSAYSIAKFHDMSSRNALQTKWGSQLDAVASQLKGPFTCFPDCGAALSYWVVRHHQSTMDNFSPEATPLSILEWKRNVRSHVARDDCSPSDPIFSQFQIAHAVTDTSYCQSFRACGFSISFVSEDWCVISLRQ